METHDKSFNKKHPYCLFKFKNYHIMIFYNVYYIAYDYRKTQIYLYLNITKTESLLSIGHILFTRKMNYEFKCVHTFTVKY